MFNLLQGAALLGGVNTLHTSFPVDGDTEYAQQGNAVLLTLLLYFFYYTEVFFKLIN